MLFSIYKEPVLTDRIRKFDNEFYLFENGANEPIAFRSYDITDPRIPTPVFDKALFEIGAFSFYGCGDAIYCLYQGRRKIVGCISPLENTLISERTLKELENYFKQAYRLDPNAISLRTALEGFEELVASAADFCGCLTDILRDIYDTPYRPQYSFSVDNKGCEHIALALPIIALMFRRISALRGFNFKVTVKDSLPCLIFSAKVLIDNNLKDPSDIREYSALYDILGDNGMIVDAKIREADNNGEVLHRLSIVLCPQTVDPRGILRAPAWRKQAQSIIKGLDIDLDGKY